MNIEKVQRETRLAAQVSNPAPSRISNPQASLLPRSCRHVRLRHGGLGISEKRAFWKNEPKLNFSENRSKWLLHNHLRTEMEVVKKRQLEKRTQFGVSSNESRQPPCYEFKKCDEPSNVEKQKRQILPLEMARTEWPGGHAWP